MLDDPATGRRLALVRVRLDEEKLVELLDGLKYLMMGHGHVHMVDFESFEELEISLDGAVALVSQELMASLREMIVLLEDGPA